MSLTGKTILITGAGKRIGRALALAVARAGADVVVHYGNSPSAAEQTALEIRSLGRRAVTLQADLAIPSQAAALVGRAIDALGPLDALVNNAAIFESLDWQETSLASWERHLAVNLTAPFLLSQAFAGTLEAGASGRIVNILDWRALRPGPYHLPYTISKAGLVALTRSLAQALAPRISVNGLALGAILPPSDGGDSPDILTHVPARRWAEPGEVESALLFLLTGPAYITGEIIHVDGGRHLV
jgi:pteridine reductase